MKTPKVEILEYSDCKKAARTLYESFDNDDVAKFVSRHLEDNPELKKQCDLLMYEAYIHSHILKGLVVGIKGDDHEESDSFETVAVFTHPNSGELDDYLTLVRSGFARLAWMTGAEGRQRIFGTMFKVLHENFENIMSVDPDGENTWTLVYLGSTPKARGKGNVRALMDYMFTNHIDPANSITYLESSAIKNLPIYSRFDFVPVADIWLGDKNDKNDSARMDVMVRGPQGKPWKFIDETRERTGYVVPSV
ncbi:hypothetical protein OGAPHI_007446 [Ogataea philodendri]|uniref:N-acetyltransferase domain-containing protein n=1 Tax=Ogataea philodendri TaxID=1378263 RepID=A0A9P8SZB4_9ASCO|nr:uncharacterized protein OGAPHI_007446 [Ogataea philodendri]KAH3660241.1 hypothetical protein OGAPHI_007446 [Ogataea philodendri]